MSSFASPLRRAPRLSLHKLAYAACLVAVAAGPVHAQNSSPAQSGRQAEAVSGQANPIAQLFEIKGFDFDNQAGLDEAALQRVRAVFDAIRGQARTMSDVTGARLAAQASLDKVASGVIAVNIPEQTMVAGRIKVVVNRTQEKRIGAVRVAGTPGFSDENVRASVPALKEGVAFDQVAVETQLRLGQLNPFKTTKVTLDAPQSGSLTATVTASAERSRLGYVSADNFGPSGARARLGAGYINGNLTGRDDTMSINAVTASDTDRLQAVSLGYSLPFYSAGQLIELGLAHSKSDSGTVDIFNINGSGSVFSAKWSYLLPQFGGGDNLRLTAGYLYHKVDNNVTLAVLPGMSSLIASGATAPLSFGIEGTVQPPGSAFLITGGVNLVHNFAGKLGSSSEQTLNSMRQDAGDFTLVNGRVKLQTEFAQGWQLQASLQGQLTADALTAADQLNIAGPYAVRGFRDAGVLGDSAAVASTELVTPALGAFGGLTVRGWGFMDAGTVRRNKALPGELKRASLSSTGLGLRASGTVGSLDLYVARKLSGAEYDSYTSRNTVWLSGVLRF